MPVKLGDYAIFGEIDAPILKMIAKVVGFQVINGKSYANGEYLFHPKLGGARALTDTVTPIADFGVELLFPPSRVYVARSGSGLCIATYSDGVPRQWQQPVPFWADWPLKKKHSSLPHKSSAGEFIIAAMESQGQTVMGIAESWKLPMREIYDLIEGRIPISVEHARLLANEFHTSPELWLNFNSEEVK